MFPTIIWCCWCCFVGIVGVVGVVGVVLIFFCEGKNKKKRGIFFEQSKEKWT